MRVVVIILWLVVSGVVGWPPADTGRDNRMGNLISNGEFHADLTGWETGLGGNAAVWVGDEGNSVPGSAKMEGLGGDPCVLRQTVTVVTAGKHRLRFAVKAEKAGGVFSFLVRFDTSWWNIDLEPGVAGWQELEFEVPLQAGAEKLIFSSYNGYIFYIDDVELEAVSTLPGYQEYFVHRLMSERQDIAAIFHTRPAYLRAIEEAVAAAPREVWPTSVYATTSLVTVAGQEDYSLGAIGGLSKAVDVVDVQLRPAAVGETAYQDWRGVGWRAYDEASGVVLRFDRPWADNYQLRVLYRSAPAAPSDDAATDLDYEYLIADAMVRLLRRRPLDLSVEERMADLQFWMLQRETRRQAVEHVRPARRAITPYWPL